MAIYYRRGAMTIYYRIVSRVLHCPSAGTNPMTAFQ